MHDKPGASDRRLPGLTKSELLQLYGELFETAPPSRLRRELLQRVVAYGLQAQEFGGLRDETRRHLRSLMRSLEGRGDAGLLPMTRVKPGTRLIRRWRDRTHVVTVEECGFAYEGFRYNSLSEVARVITGIKWSGPLFFGLKRRQANSAEDHNER